MDTLPLYDDSILYVKIVYLHCKFLPLITQLEVNYLKSLITAYLEIFAGTLNQILMSKCYEIKLIKNK